MEEFRNKKPPAPLLVSFDAEDLRKQAAASTQRFQEGIAELYVDIYINAVISSSLSVRNYFTSEQSYHV